MKFEFKIWHLCFDFDAWIVAQEAILEKKFCFKKDEFGLKFFDGAILDHNKSC